MTDGERARIREAFDTMRVAMTKAKNDTVNGAAFQGAVAALGWVLDDKHAAPAFEVLLREIKSMLGNKITSWIENGDHN